MENMPENIKNTKEVQDIQIEAKNLTYVYGGGTAFEQHAIKNISFKIKKNEFVGIIGHTGSGKSTLIQHLNGLIRATSGKLYFNGEDIYAPKYDMKLLRQRVGLVFQYPEHQLFETDVISDVMFGPKNQKLDIKEVEKRARESLALVGLDESYYKKSPFELSGGQKRRVAIAGVLAMHPEVLILDEPTAGLDPRGRDELFEKILELKSTGNMTIMLVSHSMEDVAKYVERLLVMNDGELVLDGSPKEIFKQYKLLEGMGLSAPQVTYIVERLKSEGVNLGDGITTIKEAGDAILEIYRRKGQK